MTPCAVQQTVRHGLVSWIAPDGMTRVCGEDGVYIRIAQEMIRKFFEIGNFRVLRCMLCNTVLVFVAIARLAEVVGDVGSVECLRLTTSRQGFV